MTDPGSAGSSAPASSPTATSAAGSASAPDAQRWTVRTMLAWSRDWLAKKGIESPRLDAELLLADALKLQRIQLYVEHDKPLQPDELARFKALILRRAEREPVAYLLGAKEFYGRAFAVDKRAFIPRPETELLVQAALAGLPPKIAPAEMNERSAVPAAGLRVLDLCAGSGAVGVTIAAEREDVQVDLVELSPDTAEVTRANAATHAGGRAQVFIGDLFAALPQTEPRARYAAIASNPPYVQLGTKDRLAPEITRHEPALALYAGADGLDVIRRIIAEAREWLVPGGMLAIELDPMQAEVAVAISAASGFIGARVERDLAGLLRTLIARAPRDQMDAGGAAGSNRDEPRLRSVPEGESS